ncbi:hypothetical protein bcere0019_57570 [Bacillus cereus Rock3-28]|nr:hypothetical protein bcere0019_57570 [Bacillus cereus Rock3-28]
MNYKHQSGSYMHSSSIINTLKQGDSFGFVKINSMAIKNKD